MYYYNIVVSHMVFLVDVQNLTSKDDNIETLYNYFC